MLILKGVKVLCFDTLLEVFILKVLSIGLGSILARLVLDELCCAQIASHCSLRCLRRLGPAPWNEIRPKRKAGAGLPHSRIHEYLASIVLRLIGEVKEKNGLAEPGLPQESEQKMNRSEDRPLQQKEWSRAPDPVGISPYIALRWRRLEVRRFGLAGLRLRTLGGRILLVALWPARSKARHRYQLATVR